MFGPAQSPAPAADVESGRVTLDNYVALAMRTEAPIEPAIDRITGYLLSRVLAEPGAVHALGTPLVSDQHFVTLRLVHGYLGLANEVGELSKRLKGFIFHGKPMDRTNTLEELGDLCWYVALVCSVTGISLGEVLQSNIDKLRARYPIAYSDAQSDPANRDLEAERRALEQSVAMDKSAAPNVNPPTPASLQPMDMLAAAVAANILGSKDSVPSPDQWNPNTPDEETPLADDQWRCPACRQVWDKKAGYKCACGLVNKEVQKSHHYHTINPTASTHSHP